jgi:hypothetical protein
MFLFLVILDFLLFLLLVVSFLIKLIIPTNHMKNTLKLLLVEIGFGRCLIFTKPNATKEVLIIRRL